MAKSIVNILADKIFPSSVPVGDQTENPNLKTLLFSQPISRGDADAALNHITGKFIERQAAPSRTAAVNKSGDGDDASPQKTVVDFYKKVLQEQPFDADSLSKKKVSVVLNAKKSAAQMTVADYDMAKDRAIFKEAGYAMLTDEEIKMAVSAVKAHGSVNHGGDSLNKLRRIDNQPGWMFVKTDKATIEYAKRAAQAVLQYQSYKAGELDAAIEKGRNYATDALGGFIQPIVNAPVNIFNGVSEPFRAAERISFGTRSIPEIPRMQVAERSEYWNKDGRMVINRGAEIGTTILLGGATGGKAIGTQAGRIFLGTESAYNIGAGVFGRDVTQPDAQGNARQMPLWERGLRVTGGVFGARQTINTEIATPNSAVNKLDDIFKNSPTIRPQVEFITSEGFRIKTNVEQIPDNVLLSKAKAQETNSIGRRNLDSHEGVSGVREGKEIGHTILKHVGKSERALQNRLLNESNTPSASSFHNKSVGNRTIANFIKENKEAIEQWAKNGEDGKFVATTDMKEDIGLVVNRSKKGAPLAAEKATKAEIVLVKDSSEYGWHLFTVKLQK